MLRAVLFDMDDTLIDWSDFDADWIGLERRHLRGVFDYINTLSPDRVALPDFDAYGMAYRQRVLEAWSQARVHLQAPNMVRLMIDAAISFGIDPAPIDDARVMAVTEWAALPGVVTFPDVPPVLGLLRDHGIGLGIITNAFQPMAMRDQELVDLGLRDYFPTCRFSAADVGYLKPHPTIFKTALGCLDLTPEQVVFVGDDSEADIAGAQSVGMKAVLRRLSHRPESINGLNAPDATIDSFDELPALFDSWYPDWRRVGESR